MEAVATRGVVLVRGELALCALIAAASAVTVAALSPPGGDAAAHLYRSELVGDGVVLWDKLAGRVPAAGVYRLRVRWTPYWDARVSVCLERAADGSTLLRARGAGEFVLEAAFPGGAACPHR